MGDEIRDGSGMSPLVSVVIPTYRRPGLISRSLRSVLRQTFTNFELLVVNERLTDAVGVAERQREEALGPMPSLALLPDRFALANGARRVEAGVALERGAVHRACLGLGDREVATASSSSVAGWSIGIWRGSHKAQRW